MQRPHVDNMTVCCLLSHSSGYHGYRNVKVNMVDMTV